MKINDHKRNNYKRNNYKRNNYTALVLAVILGLAGCSTGTIATGSPVIDLDERGFEHWVRTARYEQLLDVTPNALTTYPELTPMIVRQLAVKAADAPASPERYHEILGVLRHAVESDRGLRHAAQREFNRYFALAPDFEVSCDRIRQDPAPYERRVEAVIDEKRIGLQAVGRNEAHADDMITRLRAYVHLCQNGMQTLQDAEDIVR